MAELQMSPQPTPERRLHADMNAAEARVEVALVAYNTALLSFKFQPDSDAKLKTLGAAGKELAAARALYFAALREWRNEIAARAESATR